ncbi:MAG: Na(+)-translocating NADH-quinone reductase subunit A, partial [Muribaculaceae bacterium]
AGTPLYHDKDIPDIKVTSPISGKVSQIIRGERRKIESIVICEQEKMPPVSHDVSKVDATSIKSVLLSSGLWAFMRQRPYDIVPNPLKAPRDIFVTAFDSAPLAPDFALLLQGKENYLEKGVAVLSQLTTGKVYIGVPYTMPLAIKGAVITAFDGPHPAGNVGVQIANIKPVNKGEVIWTLDAITLVRIGELFTTGIVPYTCEVAITGSEIVTPKYIKTTIGAPISALLDNNIKSSDNVQRIISGNVLTGYKVDKDSFLRFPYRQITVIPDLEHKDEFMGWASISPKKYSLSHSFTNWLFSRNKPNKFDARINGGKRAIIMAGEYDKMLPMDIYAEFLIKSIIAFDIDKMEQLGIYEIAPEDFALCEFADTSKLELQQIVRDGLDKFRKEMN